MVPDLEDQTYEERLIEILQTHTHKKKNNNNNNTI